MKDAESILLVLHLDDLGYFASPSIRDLTIMYPDAWRPHFQIGRAIRRILIQNERLNQNYYACGLELLRVGHPSTGRDVAILLCRMAALEYFMEEAVNLHLISEVMPGPDGDEEEEETDADRALQIGKKAQ